MQRLLLIVLSTIAIGNVAVAADKPDFSGSWTMNAAKTSYGQFPAPSSFTRKIAHAEPSLSVAEDQQGGGATGGITTRTMMTDGKIVENNVNGAVLNCSAAWDGTALIVITAIDGLGLNIKDKMSLSDDGKELTSKITVEFPQGSGELTVVFDRQ